MAATVTLGTYAFVRGDDWTTVEDEPSGVVLRRPPGWSVQTFGRYCRRVGPGLLVSNLRSHTFENVTVRNGCTSRWDLAGLASDFVLVDVSLFASPIRHYDQADTPLPLELEGFTRRSGDNYAYGGIVRGRSAYTVRVWTGTKATRADEEALARLIRSIRVTGATD